MNREERRRRMTAEERRWFGMAIEGGYNARQEYGGIGLHTEVHRCPECGAEQLMVAPPWDDEKTQEAMKGYRLLLGDRLDGCQAVFWCNDCQVSSFCKTGGTTLHLSANLAGRER